jgi:hypothetical protein
MSEVQGKLVNMKIRVNGTLDAWKTLVCTEDSQFQITNETTERRTNCGVKTGVAQATFNASGNAVQNPTPTALEVSYNDVKGWQKGTSGTPTKLDFQYISDADASQGLAEGDGVNNFGSGYFTDTTFTASAEADGVGSFSWSFTGTGTLDAYDEEDPT